jgi:adenylate cyclase
MRTLISRGIEAKLGGEEREVTIFFSDLVDFTRISEELGNELIPHMSVYLQSMSEEIIHQKGTIDKYIGDSIMAFWGAPNQNDFHPLDACRAALNCQKELKALRFRWKRECKPLFFTRIGINTGKVLVGNMGSENKMNYTIIGDSVNVASRLEALNKKYGTEILIGEDTYKEVKDDVVVRKLDRVKVYGKEGALDIYELLEMRDEITSFDKFDWIEVYEEGLALYQDAKFEEAIVKFKTVLEMKKDNDKPSLIFITKSIDYLKDENSIGFDGITTMKDK